MGADRIDHMEAVDHMGVEFRNEGAEVVGAVANHPILVERVAPLHKCRIWGSTSLPQCQTRKKYN